MDQCKKKCYVGAEHYASSETCRKAALSQVFLRKLILPVTSDRMRHVAVSYHCRTSHVRLSPPKQLTAPLLTMQFGGAKPFPRIWRQKGPSKAVMYSMATCAMLMTGRSLNGHPSIS